MSKILVTVSLLLNSYFFFGQNQSPSASAIQVKNNYFKLVLNDLPKPIWSFDSKFINITNNQLSVYNFFSKNNDNYIVQQESTMF